MNKTFWKNKHVLVTGHNGYKGCWLIKLLDSLGAIVYGVSLENDEKSGLNEMKMSGNFHNYIADLKDFDASKVVEEINPEIVIHLAAQAIVKAAKENPVETFATNVMGTVNLLEHIRECNRTKAIVIITSDKVYENIENMDSYVETDRLMGNEPYSCSKVCEEQVAKAYYDTYFKYKKVSVATARASNTYGGCDFHFDRLIPYLEKCSFEGVVPQVRNEFAVRPWTYILDTLNGYMSLAESIYSNENTEFESFNFGPDKENVYTVGDLASLICCEYSKSKYKQDFYESSLLMIDSRKALEKLKWKPYITFEEGIKETNRNYIAYFENISIDEIYDDSVKRYLKVIEQGEED